MFINEDGAVGVFKLLPDGRAGEMISSHPDRKTAEAALNRYADGDRRRGTTNRSGADIINDLTR
jgi:hypothetical protein